MKYNETTASLSARSVSKVYLYVISARKTQDLHGNWMSLNNHLGNNGPFPLLFSHSFLREISSSEYRSEMNAPRSCLPVYCYLNYVLRERSSWLFISSASIIHFAFNIDIRQTPSLNLYWGLFIPRCFFHPFAREKFKIRRIFSIYKLTSSNLYKSSAKFNIANVPCLFIKCCYSIF